MNPMRALLLPSTLQEIQICCIGYFEVISSVKQISMIYRHSRVWAAQITSWLHSTLTRICAWPWIHKVTGCWKYAGWNYSAKKASHGLKMLLNSWQECFATAPLDSQSGDRLAKSLQVSRYVNMELCNSIPQTSVTYMPTLMCVWFAWNRTIRKSWPLKKQLQSLQGGPMPATTSHCNSDRFGSIPICTPLIFWTLITTVLYWQSSMRKDHELEMKQEVGATSDMSPWFWRVAVCNFR